MMDAAPYVIAFGLFALITGFTVWANRPTKTDIAVYELGFNDGAEGRTPEKWDHPQNARTYHEGYRDGSSGRNRRTDAERLRSRTGD